MRPPDIAALAVYVILLYFSLNTVIGSNTGDQCDRFDRCLNCTGNNKNCSNEECHVKCGWDDMAQKCKAGTEWGPTDGKTSSWFYYNCNTSESSGGCSHQIARTPCINELCSPSVLESSGDEYNKSLTKFLCEKCRSYQNCFDKTKTCHTWNNTKCPNGSITDYNNKTLADLTVFNPQVRHINPNTTILYACGGLDEDLDKTVILTEGTGLDYGENRVLLSEQAGTISHVVNESHEIGNWTVMFARKAALDDILSFADFRYKVADPPLFEPLLTELDTPNMSVIKNLKTISNPSYKVHDLSFSKDLYRLAGMEFLDDHNVTERRSILAVPKDEAAKLETVNGGDVIFAEDSVGYLERVYEVHYLPGNRFIAKTKLLQGKNGQTNLQREQLKKTEGRVLACAGGDMRPGIAVYEVPTGKPAWLTTDSVIVGRQSSQVALEVVSIFDAGDFTLYEGYPISAINSDAEFTTIFGPKDKTHQARKRNAIKRKWNIYKGTLKFSKKFGDDWDCAKYIRKHCKKFCKNVDCGVHVSVEPYVILAVNVYLTKQ